MNKILLLISCYCLFITNITAQVISEIQYKTPGASGVDDEWVEICNPSGNAVNISDFQFFVEGNLEYTFPTGAMIAADECITLALRDDGDDTNVFNDQCPFTPDYVKTGLTINGSTDSGNILANSNPRSLELKNAGGNIIDQVVYNNSDYNGADGKTFTLIDLDSDNSSTTPPIYSWILSNDFGGSPGLPGNVLCPNSSTELQFRTLTTSIEESAGTISTVVCVTIQRPSMTEATTVELHLDGGTATNGVDTKSFATLTTLTFPAGSLAEQCLEITIIEDEENEGNETFNFSLQNPMGGRNMAQLDDNTTFELVILENDYASAIINEVLFNPPGTDGDREYIEIKGDANANLSGITLLYIDGDAGSIGKIQQAIDLSDIANSSVILGDNGLALIGKTGRTQSFSPAPDPATTLTATNLNLQNGSATFLLITNYQNPTNDTDLDDDDNGVLDIILWDTVLDAVSILDGGADDMVFAATLGGTDLPDNSAGKAEAIFRDGNSDWLATTLEGGTDDYQFDLENVWDSSNQLLDLNTFSPTLLTPGGVLQASPPLALQFIDFQAIVKEKQISLQWVTAQEDNHSYFTINRSKDGIHYTEIGRVDGLGDNVQKQRYEFKDNTPLKGYNFYQLGGVDFSGKVDWSTVLQVQHVVSEDVKIYPTIVRDVLNIEGQNDVIIFDASGTLVYEGVINQSINTNFLTIGIYFVLLEGKVFKITKI